MALELQPFLSMLETYQRERQRREQEETRQRPVNPPEWARRLDPDQFKGKTRAMLLEAQAAAPNGDMPGLQHPVGRPGGAVHGNDLVGRGGGQAEVYNPVTRMQGGGSQPAPSPMNMGITDDGPVMDGINRVMAEERHRPQQPRLSSEQLSGLVPFDTRPPLSPVVPDTRQRLSPAPAQRRLSPVSEPRERIVGQDGGNAAETLRQEAAAVKARKAEMALEQTNHPHPARPPDQQPNFRRVIGPYVGDGGDFVNMARQYRQTGELPGLNGLASSPEQGRATPAFRSRAQPETARGSGGSDTLAGRSGSPQPTAARASGGGLFGGDGPGLGYVIGGIGAMLQEAGGQQGAASRYAETYGERYRKQLASNKTAQRAKKMGVPDDHIALFLEQGDGPGLAKYTLEWEKAQKEAKQPDYGFMNVDGTVIRTDKRGGTVSPVYEGAGGQTIPGTKIGFDTDIGRKYSAFRGQGFDHDQALGVASGRYDLKVTDNGLPVMIDTLTNREVPIQRLGPAEIGERQQLGPTPGRQQQGQPQQAGQTDALGLDPQRDKTLYEMADSGTGLWNIMGDFFGRVGPQFAPGDKAFFNDQREAVTTIRTANRGLVRALQQSPRYAEGERTSIEKEIALNPSIGMSPEAWRQSAVAVDGLLRSWWQEDMQDAQSSTLAANDRQRALASARAIERYLQLLGVPQDGGQGGEGQDGGQGAADIAPGTIAVHPQTGQRIQLNQNGEWEEVR